MYFESVHAVLTMDGHGGFVWSAYAVTCGVVGWLLVAPMLRRTRILRDLRGAHKRSEGAAATVGQGEV